MTDKLKRYGYATEGLLCKFTYHSGESENGEHVKYDDMISAYGGTPDEIEQLRKELAGYRKLGTVDELKSKLNKPPSDSCELNPDEVKIPNCEALGLLDPKDI